MHESEIVAERIDETLEEIDRALCVSRAWASFAIQEARKLNG
jgi:hypothetical protein